MRMKLLHSPELLSFFQIIKHFMTSLSQNLLKLWWLGVLFLAGCATPQKMELPADFKLPQPRSSFTPTASKSLSEFESEVKDDGNYRLGAGDQVTIEIWGYPELSGAHTIGPDGRITLPLVGPFKLANSSREQAAQDIKQKLSSYYHNLTTTVRVDKYAANRVLVLGRVVRPGEVQFGNTAPTLLESIALAGGLSNTRKTDGLETLPLTRCAVFRGRDKVAWIGLEPLLTGKDLSLNMRLQRNDVVYVPELEERLVYVLGAVSHPGAFSLTPNMSFLEALSKAGGPTEDAAPSKINVIRLQQGTNQQFNLDDLLKGQHKLNIALQEGDILYVPTNTIHDITYVTQILNPFSTVLRIFADIETIRANVRLRRIENQQDQLEADQAALQREKEQLNQQLNDSSGVE